MRHFQQLCAVWLFAIGSSLLLATKVADASSLQKKSHDTAENELSFFDQQDNRNLAVASGRMGHMLARRQNFKDACPHIEVDAKQRYKVRLLAVKGRQRMCCVCPPGTFVEDLCRPGKENFKTTVCSSCPQGTYQDDFAHNHTKCKVDFPTSCPSDEIYIPSNITVAPRCVCNPDKPLFRSPNGSCLLHSSCPPGYGVLAVGTPFSDTSCYLCPNGFESPFFSFTDGCYLKNNVKMIAPNLHLFPTPESKTFNFANTPSPTGTRSTQYEEESISRATTSGSNTDDDIHENRNRECSSEKTLIGVFIGIVVFLVLVLLIMICLLVYEKNFRNDMNEHRLTTPEEVKFVSKRTSNASKPRSRNSRNSVGTSYRSRNYGQRVVNCFETNELLFDGARNFVIEVAKENPSEAASRCKYRAVPARVRFSRADSLLSTGSSNHGFSSQLDCDANAKIFLQRRMVDYCIARFKEESKHSSWEIDMEKVSEYCYTRNIAVPTDQERKTLTPAHCMANAIERDYEMNQVKYLDLIKVFRSLQLNTIADLLSLQYIKS